MADSRVLRVMMPQAPGGQVLQHDDPEGAQGDAEPEQVAHQVGAEEVTRIAGRHQ